MLAERDQVANEPHHFPVPQLALALTEHTVRGRSARIANGALGLRLPGRFDRWRWRWSIRQRVHRVDSRVPLRIHAPKIAQ